jgi:hypothetical protein
VSQVIIYQLFNSSKDFLEHKNHHPNDGNNSCSRGRPGSFFFLPAPEVVAREMEISLGKCAPIPHSALMSDLAYRGEVHAHPFRPE